MNREIHKMQNELQNLKEIKRRESGYENSERLFADIRQKCNRLKETMQRTHERKMETFYHLENFDSEKEEFQKLRINVERQLGQGIKRKRKRKRPSKRKLKD